MISSLLFSMSALCFVAMFVPQRPRQPRPQVETYYVCDPDSRPESQMEFASPAMAGELRG